MATYLVAIVVSELKPIPISEGPPAMTVWARPNITEALVAEKVSAALLGNMSISFGVPQPVPKYDLVALPDLYFGAMENWGLVTFRWAFTRQTTTPNIFVIMHVCNGESYVCILTLTYVDFQGVPPCKQCQRGHSYSAEDSPYYSP